MLFICRLICSCRRPDGEENVIWPTPFFRLACCVHVVKVLLDTTASLGEMMRCDACGEYSMRIGMICPLLVTRL